MAYSDVFLTAYGDGYGSVSRTDTYDASYTRSYGSQFPGAPLDVQVELDLNGTWTPITGDVYQRDGTDAITIGRGRPDETSQATPGTLAMQLNNRTGRYSPRNPLSDLYGQFGRNTPVRVSVPALEPFLRLENDQLSGAQCPDASPLDAAAGIDVRVDLDLSSYEPCVLASKWAADTGSVELAGTIVGATCNQACYPAATSQFNAAQIMDGIVGRPVAETSQKVFFEAGTTATFPSSVLSKDKGLLNAKILLWLCYKPAVDGSDSAALLASISAYLAYALSAGAPQPKVILWQEPQDSSNVPLGLTSAAVFKTMMGHYYSSIKALSGSPAVVYCSASHGGEASVRQWYPGDSLCDEVGQDLYGYSWKFGGITLGTLESIANAASPPKPLSQLEAGSALSQSQADAMSQQDVTDYFAYSTGVFQARSAAGLPNGSWMWFNGLGGANWNTIGHGDFRIGLIAGISDALQPSSGGGSSNGRSWALLLNADGTLSFVFTSDGTLATLVTVTSTAPVPLGRVTLRAYASSASSVTFWTAPAGCAGSITEFSPWSQLGATLAPGSLSIATTTAPLVAGYSPQVAADFPACGGPAGQLYGFQLRTHSGSYQDVYATTYGAVLGGTAVADAAFTSQPPGTTSWTDAEGNQWGLTGNAEISQRSYRFHGEMSSLPTQWDASGNDVWSPVQAGGLLRRMSQGTQPPVNSALTRAVLGLSGALAPVAYWPCEDTTGAGQLGPAIGAAPITFTQLPQLAANSSFDCSLPIPTVTFGQWTGPVQPYSGGTAVVVRFLMNVPASPTISDDSIICRINTTGSIGDVTLKWKTGGELRFTGYGSGAFQWDTGADASFAVDGELLLVSIELTQSGSALAWQLAVLPVGEDTPVTVNGTVSASTPGNVTAVHFGLNSTSLSGTGLGQVFVQTAYEPVTDFAAALAAYSGETCAARFARLCGENGVAARIYGPPALDVPMGAQQPDTLVNLLQLCESTGRGQITEPRQSLSLGYRTVRALCSQAPQITADYSAAHLGDGSQGLVPIEDDQYTVNDVSVSSQDGGSYRTTLTEGAMSAAPPPDGVGDYGNSYTVNTVGDSQLPSAAGWILHTGTVAEERYPVIPYHLARDKAAPVFFAVQEADIGDYQQVVSTPPFLPPGPVRQLLYGTTEVLGGRQFRVAFNAVPESPYEVGIFADPVFGHMDTDGSQLDADIGTGDTVFTVDTTGPSGLPWTTDAADFPFDILVGGEQMTVTGVTGPPVNFLAGDDVSFETSAGNWVAGTGCTVAQSSAAADLGSGSLALTSNGSGTMTALSCAPASIFTLGLGVSPGDTVKCTAVFKAATSGRFCAAAVDWYNGTGTFLATSIGTPVIDGAGAFWSQVSASFSAPSSAAFAAADMQVATTALDSGAVHYLDNVFLGNVTAGGTPQQQFTVIRSVNGVVKAHSAGEPVSLAHPAIIALA